MKENGVAPAKILVVDDSSDNLVIISLSLQDQGYRVVTAENGEEAIQVAAIARPNLILMDIGMPQLDGFASARRIQEIAELKDVPIVALTAFATDGFRQAAFDADFAGFLTKPIDFPRLFKLIELLLTKKRVDEATSQALHETKA